MSLAADLSGDLGDYVHGRVPRAVRERQILGLAQQLFAESGYTGASMDELARRAGVSKPVVYDLVGSKEQLYRRCVEELSGELSQRIAVAAGSQTDPEAQLRAGVAAFFAFVAEHRSEWEALAWEVTPFAAEAADVRRRQTELVAALLASNANRLGARVDPKRVQAMAHFLNGAIESLARWWRNHDDVGGDVLTDWVVELVLPGLQRVIDESRVETEGAS
ncbi:MAG: TetR/AcrR family transcriptional regulator [Candidatus Dormibacteraeota bacterium]|nr:TetR/AcrR family transcriptional regulator [Candidatus Dormibacteraeota bacterium]